MNRGRKSNLFRHLKQGGITIRVQGTFPIQAAVSTSRDMSTTKSIALGLFSFVAATLQAATAVTFTETIAPIVLQNCASCHRPGEKLRHFLCLPMKTSARRAL